MQEPRSKRTSFPALVEGVAEMLWDLGRGSGLLGSHLCKGWKHGPHDMCGVAAGPYRRASR